MEQSAAPFLKVASIVGIYQPFKKNVLWRRLYQLYSFCLLSCFTGMAFHIIGEAYLRITQRSVGAFVYENSTILLCDLMFECSLCVQYLASWYWLIMKNREFSSILKRLTETSQLLCCEKPVSEQVKKLNAKYFAIVLPSILLLIWNEFYLYAGTTLAYTLQVAENSFGCFLNCTWQCMFIFMIIMTGRMFFELNRKIEVRKFINYIH